MKAHKRVLPNGLRIITVPMEDAATVTGLILVEAGTKYETKDQNGISHFLEHVCFKGTLRRPNYSIITSELDGVGAQSNAFTGHEFTGYYAKAHPKQLPKILDVLSDIYLNSTFPEEEVEKEKGVIVEEINMYEDQPKWKAGVLWDALLYGDQPAGWSILGTKEVVRSITPTDFKAYRQKHYVADSTIIVVAGLFDEKKTIALIRDLFKNISTARKSTKKKVVEKQSKPKLLIHKKNIDQTHIVLGVRTFKGNDPRNTTLLVLDSVLGGGMSSRVGFRLREQLGICYYAQSFIDEYTDHGSFGVAAGVDTTRVDTAIKAIVDEFEALRDVLVTEEELVKAKEYLIGNMYLGLETSDALSNMYAMDEIVGKKLEGPKSLEKKIRAVTAKDIQKLAKEIFKNDRLNLVVVGKSPQEKKLRSVLKI